MHRQPYKGCPFECNLAEITQNETVWRMRTNNVKRVFWPGVFSEHSATHMIYGLFCNNLWTEPQINIKQLLTNVAIKHLID